MTKLFSNLFFFLPTPVSKEEGENIDAGVGEKNGE